MIVKVLVIFLIWYLIGMYTFYLIITEDEDFKIKDLALGFAFSFSGIIGIIAYFLTIKGEKTLFKKRF